MGIEPIIERVRAASPDADVTLLQRAYDFAARVHKGQERISGEPYLSHPIAVAEIVANLKMDVASIAAALLHDVVEDTHASLEEVKEAFGDEIGNLVDGLTKISKLPFGSRIEHQAESLRKMVLAMSKDIRVILIKLADRLHNMRTLEPLREEKRRLIARETLDIYAPIAHRLGIYWMKAEFEDLALRYLERDIYQDLAARIAKKRREREKDINEAIGILQQKLTEVGIRTQIIGRPKHFYSIYKKMRDQQKEFDEIYDLTAVRVITESVKDCYGSLGVIHSLWKPIPGRFKDFIAMPKSNMYQSLHTTVIGPVGEPVEIQIRTHEMHKTAEEGIAAHWVYKEGKAALDPADKGFAWIRQLLEWQRDLKDSREFLETVKVDLFPEEVYVFTPKGDVKNFPKGACPIDFAFGVHSDIGLTCTGAKANGRLVPLRYELQHGDIIEILTDAKHHPSRDWLKLVKTSRARGRIKQWIKNEEKVRSISLGKDLLEKELRRLGKSPSQILKADAVGKVLAGHGYASPDEFYATVGYGKLSPRQAIAKLLPADELPHEGEVKPERKIRQQPDEGVTLLGAHDFLVRFARCCSPLPGDEIVGFITRGRGVSVHSRDCSNIDQLLYDPDRKINVSWDAAPKIAHQVKIRVMIGEDRPGILAAISLAISASKINIAQADIRVTEDRKGLNTFTLEVSDLKQLQSAMGAIRQINGVMGVERLRG
ncbi:bifunctional (p)ppGpp synthetase/guanosine-3',5'-bis(diphosphate) 3'-pyrophosphohydrolase [Candidatus Methylomirabilis sp.]|uniref:RelA/SpoT family protein n=1 Tax=Candidatus Methylomirabilis sp. TaxID=2032687 RepID=UPI002A65A626|nr:bifunctional (p)ppGpp synthetase/guanosine-3',5'-bis(diphosphate) 3'-pyrophosphohydrolase [Candidatus Methylomirabilis sp.]